MTDYIENTGRRIFLEPAFLPYILGQSVAIVFTRMFAKLLYRYRRFEFGAGQRLSKVEHNGGHGAYKSTAVIPISHGISFSGLIAGERAVEGN